ncbi:MAG: winged helix-turn-helix transcriptional regulator, partial [Acidobacteriaceae bacterium]|nr:winged helix-turn-helix transcriptional regulator [Acidobacteriaceae bacterium]
DAHVSQSNELNLNSELSFTHIPNAKLGASSKDTSESKLAQDIRYSDVLMRVFSIRDVIKRLKGILSEVGISHLYVFVDDFSELPEDAMSVVVDTLLAPLNNWSDELIKFKVAAYPHRVYYGQIDKTKIDEIHLDLYRLYGTTDVSAMEEKATDFTKRLVQGRLRYFAKSELTQFTETEDTALWRILFFASLGNPRILGYILFYLQESHLIYSHTVGSRAIRDAAQKYYEEKIEPYFRMNKFLQESFNERASIFSLKELLEDIVNRAKELKRHRESAVMRDIVGTPPTSHFHIAAELDSLLSTLELNFFLTKYYEMSDRDGHKVSVYALNYGLCQKYSIAFGRPTERREQRVYFIERIFDYTSLIRQFMRQNQEIRCQTCGKTYDLEMLSALQMIDMLCPGCRSGRCIVINLSKKYESILASVAPELLLPPTELGILEVLETERRAMYPGEIAAELDKSYQLVGRRGKNLAERGLVDRAWEQNRRTLKITQLAEASYFNRNGEDRLNVVSDPGSSDIA